MRKNKKNDEIPWRRVMNWNLQGKIRVFENLSEPSTFDVIQL